MARSLQGGEQMKEDHRNSSHLWLDHHKQEKKCRNGEKKRWRSRNIDADLMAETKRKRNKRERKRERGHEAVKMLPSFWRNPSPPGWACRLWQWPGRCWPPYWGASWTLHRGAADWKQREGADVRCKSQMKWYVTQTSSRGQWFNQHSQLGKLLALH